MVGMLVFGLIGIFLILFAITPVRIVLMYERHHERDHIVIEVTIWYRIRLKYEIPMIKLMSSQVKVKQQKETSLNPEDSKSERTITKDKLEWFQYQWKIFLSHIHDFYPTLQKFLKHIRCKELTWHTSMGIGDAAATGTITGLIWSIKSIILATMTNYITLQTFPRLSVQPVWNQTVIHTKFRCILTLTLGHAIVTGIRILLKLRKGRERKWQTTPSRA